jgi:hypothetical protein
MAWMPPEKTDMPKLTKIQRRVLESLVSGWTLKIIHRTGTENYWEPTRFKFEGNENDYISKRTIISLRRLGAVALLGANDEVAITPDGRKLLAARKA